MIYYNSVPENDVNMCIVITNTVNTYLSVWMNQYSGPDKIPITELLLIIKMYML